MLDVECAHLALKHGGDSLGCSGDVLLSHDLIFELLDGLKLGNISALILVARIHLILWFATADRPLGAKSPVHYEV